MVMHYRLAPYCPGSGQWETTCKIVTTYQNSTYDRGKVDCPECRDNKFFQDMERIFGKTVSPAKEEGGSEASKQSEIALCGS